MIIEFFLPNLFFLCIILLINFRKIDMGGTAIKANQDLMRSSERNATLSGVSGAA